MLVCLVIALCVGGGICAHRAGLFGGAARRGGFSVFVAPRDDQDHDEEARDEEALPPPRGNPPGMPPTAPPLVKKPSLPLVQIKRTRSFSRSEGGRSEGGGGEGGGGEGSSEVQSVATTTQGESQSESQSEAQSEVQSEAQSEAQRERLELNQWWTASPPETPSSLRSSLHSHGAPLPTPPAQRSQLQGQQLQGHMLQGEQLQDQDERAAQTIQAGERGASVRQPVHKLVPALGDNHAAAARPGPASLSA